MLSSCHDNSLFRFYFQCMFPWFSFSPLVSFDGLHSPEVCCFEEIDATEEVRSETELFRSLNELFRDSLTRDKSRKCDLLYDTGL